MKNTAFFLVLALMAAAPAHADTDPVREAQRQAQQKAYEMEQQRKAAEMQAIKSRTEMTAKRSMLGKEAEGKTDAEVNRLYDQKIANAQRNLPKNGDAMARDMQKKEAETRAERDAAMQNTFGKSLGDLENMSDEELDAYAKELEKQYGQ